MNRQKIGAFLKQLRKNKGLTQEQLAAHFYVSSRTVSRWETGYNMPDVDMLIDLADFYDVDIRQIIDGERKEDGKDRETKDTLKKVAEYAAEKEKGTRSGTVYLALGICVSLLVCTLLFANGTAGLLYGIIPEPVCDHIRILVYGVSLCLLVSCLRGSLWQEKPAGEPLKSVAATVVSKEVKRGTQQSGRSKGGYSYTAKFMTEDGQELELFTHEIEFGGLKEGMLGVLTCKGRYFVDFEVS